MNEIAKSGFPCIAAALAIPDAELAETWSTGGAAAPFYKFPAATASKVAFGTTSAYAHFYQI